MAKRIKKSAAGKNGGVSNKTETNKSTAPNVKKSLVSKKAEIDKLIVQSKKAVIDNGSMPIVKKGLAGKKPETYRLIVQSKEEVSTYVDRSPLKICLPPRAPQSIPMNARSGHQLTRKPPYACRQISPKKVQPGIFQDSEDKILDIRHEFPAMPLIRLPHEPAGRGPLRNFQRKGTFPFLRLPGELRNKVYEYAIKGNHYMIEWLNNNNKNKTLTYRLRREPTGRMPGPYLRLNAAAAHRRNALNRPGRSTLQHLPEEYYGKVPVAPLLVCKKMHEEASSVFYSKSAFNFHGLRALDHFLDKLQPIAKTSITQLFIRYRAYGHPEETINKCFKYRHDRRWEQLCWRVGDECTSLTHLSLNITLNKSPVSFCAFDDVEAASLGAQWIRPLCAFQGVNIKRCWARVHCSVKDRPVLELESYNIRKEILGDKWDEEAESKRDGFGRDIEPKPKDKAKELPVATTIRISTNGEVERL